MPRRPATDEPLPPQAGPEPTLDQVASFLVQLDGSDPGELRDLRERLVTVSMDARYTRGQPRLLRAVAVLGELLRDPGADAGEALAEVGRCIEAAGLLLAPDETPPAPSAAEASDPSIYVLESDGIEMDASLLADYITESREYMEASEAALLTLEVNPDDAEAVNTIFRAFHTIKGTSAFLGLDPIAELAHHAESLFNRFRDGELRCTGLRADVSLRAVDMLKALLQAVERRLSGAPLSIPDGYVDLMAILEDPAAAGVLEEEGELRLGDILVVEGKTNRERLEAVAATDSGAPLGLALVRSDAASLRDVAHALRAQQQQRKEAPSRATVSEPGDSSVRVRTDRLDQLIDMVGELVIAQSMVGQDATVVSDAHSDLGRKISHAGKIVRDLQELSVSLRMVPLKSTFQKMARLVRDVARKSGKLVQLVTDGEETEIDRNMVDVIGDPLVHMIRNAIDHGIEKPEARAAAGKPHQGTVRLSAYHAGGNVVVELQDDGRGLDRERILRKAIAKGIVPPDSTMTDTEIFNLIFAPGFSTAEEVTDLSGRGVGMDVVKRNIESLRGRVEISSEAGRGSTFTIRVPLTLAVTDGMLVRVADERYILPTVNIQMSFRPGPEMISTIAGKGEMVLLRGDLLPIVRLHRLFGVAGAELDPTRALLVLIGFGERRCALLVDELLGQQQVVAKSLGEGLGKVSGLSGGAILGNGRVGLILDVSEILALAQEAPPPPQSLAAAAGG